MSPIPSKNDKSKLLRNKKVVEEINRHLWIESEKAGYDIGFDRAAQDWLERFSKAWINYHIPKRKATKPKSSTSAKSAHSKSTQKRKRKT